MADIDLVLRVRDASQAGLDSVNRRMGKVASTTEQVSRFAGVAGQALGGFAAAGVGALGALIGTTISSAREIDNLAQRSGLGVEQIQALGVVAERSGGDIEDVADAAREMQLRLSEAAQLGSGPAVDALNLLGLSIEDLRALDAPAQFDLLRDAISRVPDAADRAFAAEELLGGSTERLAELFARSAIEHDTLLASIERSGVIIGEDAVESYNSAGESLDRVFESAKGLGNVIVEGLAPAIETAAGVAEYLIDTYEDGVEASEMLEERQALLALAIENSTQRTLDLSFGTVALKGEYEDLEEQLLLVETAERQAAGGAAFLQAQMAGASDSTYALSNAGIGAQEVLRAVGGVADRTRTSVAALERTTRTAISTFQRLYAAAQRARALGPARYRYQQDQRSLVDRAGPTSSRPDDVSFNPGEDTTIVTPSVGPEPFTAPTGQGGYTPPAQEIRVAVELDGKVLGETVVSEVNRAIDRGEVSTP